ncbi:MAG: alpha/beta hydrolase [Campylobacteraceae bacterium]|jgi:predicted nucleic acid-binding protein|nr:alpha/beta hydrolase [Campylobacteraceae bacterium]MBT3882430.1 alpha/beta hydrolase [Campylobacteraceae bacterium]MBT4030587.1 alpha/beta hydrolase [Campylobacteraceae bacterium]MBT4179713.1 alpha/beta hydrolase [Campylobacteraceae bacterium]MBT4571890.1 alpha/beta hydrolase [Campylobacteraceae bacterium]
MAVKQILFENNTFDISYEIINPSKKNTIVFLHGWGSNKEIMKQGFVDKFKYFKHIYIDMPGFGKSSCDVVLNTKKYASIMKIFLDTLNIKPTIIAGHSFGGKVSTLLNPKNLVLLSSAGIVEEKNAKTLLTIKMAKVFNKFGLGKVTKLLRSGDVNMMDENMYETFKNVVDEEFNKEFKKYKGNALLFWGDTDTATTLSSGKLIHSLIENSKFKSYDDDHYFFLRNADDIEKEILNGIH